MRTDRHTRFLIRLEKHRSVLCELGFERSKMVSKRGRTDEQRGRKEGKLLQLSRHRWIGANSVALFFYRASSAQRIEQISTMARV
jgi:hypothetical protein